MQFAIEGDFAELLLPYNPIITYENVKTVIKSENISQLFQLISCNQKIVDLQEYSITVFELAVLQKNREIIQILILNGVDLDKYGNYDVPLLSLIINDDELFYLAISRQKFKNDLVIANIFEELIFYNYFDKSDSFLESINPNLNGIGNIPPSLLEIAIDFDNIKAIELLQNYGSVITNDDLSFALANKKYKAFDFMISQVTVEELETSVNEIIIDNLDINSYEILKQYGFFNINQKFIGGSLLHQAISNKDIELVEKLVEDGANVNIIDEEGMTPLMKAVYSLDLCELLIDNGANIHVLNNYNDSVLSCAGKYGVPDVINLLIFQGADIMHYNSAKLTPLTCAIVAENLDNVSCLSDYYNEVQMNESKDYGYSPITSAAISSNEILEAIIKTDKVDVNGADSNDRLAINKAITYGENVQQFKILVENGSSLNDVDEVLLKDMTAFYTYSDGTSKWQPYFEVLIKNDASLHLVDYNETEKELVKNNLYNYFENSEYFQTNEFFLLKHFSNILKLINHFELNSKKELLIIKEYMGKAYSENLGNIDEETIAILSILIEINNKIDKTKIYVK